MNRNLITSAKFVVLAFMLLVPTFVHADKIPWVEWQSSSKTLTFRYDEAMDTTTASGKYTIPSDTRNTPEWTDFHFGIAKDVEKVVFAESFADARPTCSRGWFDGMSKITNIECIENLNTSEVKEMQSMFADCSSLTSVDLSHFDTGKVEDMWMMFYNCGALESIDISNFKTDSLRSMNCMFEGCTSLSSIILPKAENLKLKNLTGLFARCLLLKEIDFSGFKIPSAQEMTRMFDNCSSLTSLDLRNFDTSNCTGMYGMFLNCRNLYDINLTSFNTSNVTGASSMFNGCSSLQNIYVSDKFVLPDDCKSDEMFTNCVKLPGYDSNKVDKSMANATDGYFTLLASGSQAWVQYDSINKTLTFRYDDQKTDDDNCYKILDNVQNTPGWLDYKEDIEKVVFDRSFSYVRPVCCYAWFIGMKNLTTIEGIEYLNTSEVTDMFDMFYGCSKLDTLNLTHFNTANVTFMDNMFGNCSSLSTIYVGKTFVVSEECTGNGMFLGCSSLSGYSIEKSGIEMANYTTGYFSKYLTSAEPWAAYDANDGSLTFYYNGEKEYSDATMTFTYAIPEGEESEILPGWLNYSGKITKAIFDKSFADYRPQSCMCMFYEMSNLKSIEGIENFNTSEVTNMSGMFYGCASIELDLSHFNTSSVTDMIAMFYGCSSMKTLDLSSFNTSKVTDMTAMFNSCAALTSLDLSGFNTSLVSSMRSMFNECTNLQTVNMSNWNTSNVTDMYGMFEKCESLASVDMSHFDATANENFNSLFYNCKNLKNVKLPQSATPNLESISLMFSNCPNIEEVDLSFITTDTLTLAQYVFRGSSALQKIYVNDKFVLSKKCYADDMFKGCEALTNYSADKVGKEMANYTDGYLSLRRHFTVGDSIYNADGVDAICYDLVEIDNDEVLSSDFTFKYNAGATYNRNVTSSWSTLCLPFAFNASSQFDNFKFYEISNVGTDVISVNQITGDVEAGRPILVYTNDDFIYVMGKEGTDVVLSPIADANMVGTFKELEIENATNNYIISKNKFWNVASLLERSDVKTVKVAPYRAYITTPANESKGISLDIITDETNGISNTNADDALNLLNGAELYDMQGRCLATPIKGMMIVKKGNISKKVFFN